MKVLDLIKTLQQFSPDAEVFTGEAHYNGNDDTPDFGAVPLVYMDKGGDCLIVASAWDWQVEKIYEMNPPTYREDKNKPAYVKVSV